MYKETLEYNLQILGLIKTHISQEKVSRVTGIYQSKRRIYKVYYREIQGSNPYKGTGVLLHMNLPLEKVNKIPFFKKHFTMN